MKCPHDLNSTLSELRVGGTVAHVCKVCHGLLFKKSELELLKDHIPEHGWFDVSLWEKKELLSAHRQEEQCPECLTPMSQVDWNNGELVSLICSSCGALWLPKGEYQKAVGYIKEKGDDAVIESYGSLLSQEIEKILSGEKDFSHEVHNLASLLRFFEYRFMAKHPLITEVIEELPFVK